MLEFTTTAAGQDAEVPISGEVAGVVIDWGDGSTNTQVPDSPNLVSTYYTHTFATAGTYTVTISGTKLERFGSCNSSTYAVTLKKIVSWGELGTTSLECAGYLRGGLIAVPSTLPSTVTNLASIFKNAYSLNQSLSGWNTANVTNMTFAFYGAHQFNGDVTTWNTSSVTDMSWMFADALVFNQNISVWNTSLVTDMNSMFYNAVVFNRSLASWNITNVTDMRFMFNSSGLSNANYSSTLIGWGPQFVESGVRLDASSHKAEGCTAIAARQVLLDAPNNWNIQDTAPTDDCGTPLVALFRITEINETAQLGFGGSLTGVAINWGEYPAVTAETTVADAANRFYEYSYAEPGLHKVIVSGKELGHFGYCNTPTAGWNLIEILSWGDLNTTSFECALNGRTALTGVPNTLPDTVTNPDYAFHNAHVFNQDVSSWNTANVTSMDGTFRAALEFNNGGQPLTWNTSKVTNMLNMFSIAEKFNADVSGWNTASLTNMAGMFSAASAFNQSLASWNIEQVTDMSNMFQPATFVTSVPRGTEITEPSAITLHNGAPMHSLSDANYSATLIGWAGQEVQSGVDLGASSNQAIGCSAVAARTLLTSAPNNWVISDIAPTDVVPAGGCSPSEPGQLARTGTNASSALLWLLTAFGLGGSALMIARRRQRGY